MFSPTTQKVLTEKPRENDTFVFFTLLWVLSNIYKTLVICSILYSYFIQKCFIYWKEMGKLHGPLNIDKQSYQKVMIYFYPSSSCHMNY